MVIMSTVTFPRRHKVKLGHRSISQWSLTSVHSDFRYWSPREISYSTGSPNEAARSRNAFDLPASQLEEYIAYLEERLKEACLGLKFRSASLTNLDALPVTREREQGPKNATWRQYRQPPHLAYPAELCPNMYVVR